MKRSGVVAAVLAAMGIAAAPASAATTVVSQVYAGGGEGSAFLTHDYVELRNDAAGDVNLNGWTLQYLPAGGTSWQIIPLGGSLQGLNTYLVRLGQGPGGTTPGPAPNTIGTATNLSPSGGTVALVNSSNSLTCTTAAACSAVGSIVDHVGWGDAAVREGFPARAMGNTTALKRVSEQDLNVVDFELGVPTPKNSFGATTTAPFPLTPIHDVQGTRHVSQLVNEGVDVQGIVTGTETYPDDEGFYMQAVDAAADADPRTSEGIFVRNDDPQPVAVGDAVTVTGIVEEYSGGLPVTRIAPTSPLVKNSSNNPLPAATPITGVPGSVFSTFVGDLEGPASPILNLDEGIDFWAAKDSMRVSVTDFDIVGYGNGDFVTVAPPASGPRTTRAAMLATADDENPERVRVRYDTRIPPGGTLSATGPLTYTGLGKTYIIRGEPTVNSVPVVAETFTPPTDERLSIATTFASTSSSQPTETADEIVDGLGSPEVVVALDVFGDEADAQDVTAETNVGELVDAIVAAGGPEYEARWADPAPNEEGFNDHSRSVFLYRTDRGLDFVDRPGGNAPAIVDVVDGPALSVSPGRLDYQGALSNQVTRSVVGEFTWGGEPLFVVAYRFIYADNRPDPFTSVQPRPETPSVRPDEIAPVRAFVDDLLAEDPDARAVVTGHVGTPDYRPQAQLLTGGDDLTRLADDLAVGDRFSFVGQGNAILTDQTLLTPGAAALPRAYDIVHRQGEFFGNFDPQVLTLSPPPVVTPTPTPSPEPTASPSPTPTAAPTASPTPTPTPGPELTQKALTFALTGKGRQLILNKPAISVRVSCSGIPCRVRIAGRAKIKGRTAFKLPVASVRLAEGNRRVLRIKTTRKQRARIRRAVGRRGTGAQVVFDVRATGLTGSKKTVRRSFTVKLRRLGR